MMLEDIFRENHYPKLRELADLAKEIIEEESPSIHVEDAKEILDELKHIAVKAFQLKEIPD